MVKHCLYTVYRKLSYTVFLSLLTFFPSDTVGAKEVARCRRNLYFSKRICLGHFLHNVILVHANLYKNWQPSGNSSFIDESEEILFADFLPFFVCCRAIAKKK
jgi:hypothetical protein